MNIHDFRRIALSLEGAEEMSHMGSPDFRVGGRIFATLAAAKMEYGNIMITPEQQAAFIEELPDIFLPVKGGWGRGGATHIRLDIAPEDVVRGALQTAHRLRLDLNSKSNPRKPPNVSVALADSKPKPKSPPKPKRKTTHPRSKK